VLVTEDILGLFSDYTPKFAQKYVDLSAPIKDVFALYERGQSRRISRRGALLWDQEATNLDCLEG